MQSSVQQWEDLFTSILISDFFFFFLERQGHRQPTVSFTCAELLAGHLHPSLQSVDSLSTFSSFLLVVLLTEARHSASSVSSSSSRLSLFLSLSREGEEEEEDPARPRSSNQSR